MCGRYYIEDEEQNVEMREIIDTINRKYHSKPELESMKTGEIFPTNLAPILSDQGATIMKWGFPMHGSSKSVINARCETAFEKNMFKKAIETRRVVVPTTGFYEWAHQGKKATDKLLFTVPNDSLVRLAAICTFYKLDDGEKFPHYTILTTAANESMRPYHDRMPVFLRPDECDSWINDPQATRDILHRDQPLYFAKNVTKPPTNEQTSFF